MQAASAGRIVLAPNTELAAGLFDAIERAHAASGRDVWPTPRVRDLSGWLKERHIQRQFTDSSAPRCLSDVEERELWRRVVLESESSRQFLEPSGAARAARRARRAIYEYDIPLSAVAAHGGEESAAFIDWNARFVERCGALNCISSDQLLKLSDPASLDGSAPPITWIESPLWRPVARRWLERNAGEPLRPSAPEMASAKMAGAETPEPPRFVGADSPAAELAAIAQWSYENLQAKANFRAWVCVRDLSLRRDELVDAFDAVLAPHRFSMHDAEAGALYAVAGGTPLADYAPVRAALDLLSTSSGPVSFDKFSALLRSPHLHASASESESAARIDVALRTQAPSEESLNGWLALAESVARAGQIEPAAALGRLNAASRALEELSGTHPMSRWLSIWIAALDTGPWALRHRWSSGEFQSAERFRELLATLAVGDQLFGRQTRHAAESILRRAARDTAFQTQTGIPPIWVSGQLTDPWLAYDGLWVTGCDEARWPPPIDPIPLLPLGLQRQYGVIAASADAQLQFAENLQQRWLARARRCVFSCADPGDGRGAAPSSLLAAIEEMHLQVEPRPHWFEQLRLAPVREQLNDEQAPAFGVDEKTRGVATLKAQSRCAFRAFAETRLAAEALERPLPGFNQRERGELLHDALQRIWSEVGDSTRLIELVSRPDELTQLLRESARRAIAQLCRRRDPGLRWRERERVRLQGLLAKWLDLECARAPFAIDRLEQGSEVARHADLEFRVRVDRIDRLLDGSRVLIDYKTGAANPDWRGERPDNPQLPVYALLHRQKLVAVAYGRVNAAECGFVIESERGGIFPGKRPSKMEGAASFADLIEVWSRRVEKLAQDFADGRAAVDPTASACRSCHLHGLCRVPSALAIEGS
jgi:ATP-dependent helicase/nuclease subunit B